jgi:3-methyl-2-oxobutanoate hydroxymethyltransferase
MQEIGVFAVLLECVPSELAREITKELRVPTIGIGAGIDCDGQVLVIQDMLGLYPSQPKHARKYCDLKSLISDNVTQFRNEIKGGKFPGEENTFHMGADEISKVYGG